MELPMQPFPVVQHEFRIFIEEKAFDRICNSADAMREVGGILVGEVLRDDNGAFIRVDDIIEALHAEESGTELTITHATWNHIHEQMDTIHAGKRIIGWYHTHPNFGIFLSERDRFIQQSFFDLAFQIALVYDPVRREHGIFSWRENTPWRVRQYWIGTHEHLWDDMRDAPDDSNRKPRTRPKLENNESIAPAARKSEPQTLADLSGNTWMLGAALVGILLGFALGVTWTKRGAETTTSRAQSAQDAVASLNADLLAVIRRSLSDESFAKTFDEGIARLDRATESLKTLNISDPAVKSAVQAVTEAQQSLSRARHDRLVGHEMLQQIEEVMRRSNRTPEFIVRDLEAQRRDLGEVYAELARAAARNKEGARVNELLQRAIAVDPLRQALYEQQRQAYEKEGILPPPTEPGKKGKEELPAPSMSVAPADAPPAPTRG
jgi:proteasome lid subunit RPN8/RPN11